MKELIFKRGGIPLNPEDEEDDDSKLYKERMIPVEIACTRSEFMEIMNMSKKYYDQIKMYGFLLSKDVWIM